MKFARQNTGEHGESLGIAMFYLDDVAATKGPMRAQTGKFTLCGDGLCTGFDSGDNVSQHYKHPGTFIGGTILGVAIDVSDEAYLDLEREAAAALARD